MHKTHKHEQCHQQVELMKLAVYFSGYAKLSSYLWSASRKFRRWQYWMFF